MFKFSHGESYESQSVIDAIAADANQAPILSSRQETSYYVISKQSQTDVNKNIAAGIIRVMIPDGKHPTYTDTTGSEKILYNNIQRSIIQGNTFNDEDKLSLISYMRQFNIRCNNETRKFDMYRKAAIIAMETESAHRVHERIPAAGDYDATNRISHATFISTNHLIKSTVQII